MIDPDEVRAWLGDLEPSEAGNALLWTGAAPGMLGRAWSRQSLARYAPLTDGSGEPFRYSVVPWLITDEDWSGHIRRTAVARDLAVFVESESPTYRLLISGDLSPDVAVQWLRKAPGVASVCVAADREPGWLRPRPWRWPLRVTILGFDPDQAEAIRPVLAEATVTPLDVVRGEVEPASCDILVVQGDPEEAAERLQLHPVVANVVLTTSGQEGSWTRLGPAFDLIRQRTSAGIVACADGIRDEDMAGALRALTDAIGEGMPVDVALTTAMPGEVIIQAEPLALFTGHLGAMALAAAASARRTADLIALGRGVHLRPRLDRGYLDLLIAASAAESSVMASAGVEAGPGDSAPIAPRFEPSLIRDSLEHLHATESTAVSVALEPIDESVAAPEPPAEAAAEAAAEPEHMEGEPVEPSAPPRTRELQCTVRETGTPPSMADGRLRIGSNTLRVWIGPHLTAALGLGAIDDSVLPWEGEAAEVFRLTVVLARLDQPVEPQVRPLHLPRFGASDDAEFDISIDPDDQFAARIIVLFRNRVLQTTVLEGADGELRVASPSSFWSALEHLDDRTPFDLAILANRTGAHHAVFRITGPSIQLPSAEKVESLTTEAAVILGRAVKQRKVGLERRASVDIIIELARKGRELQAAFCIQEGDLDPGGRVQLVAASADWFLPIELVYLRPAPNETATMCPGFVEGKTSCDAKCAPPTDRSVVCPNAFLGLRNVVERLEVPPPERPSASVLMLSPKRNARDLDTAGAVVAASDRVSSADIKRVITAADTPAKEAKDWDAWVKVVADQAPHLLILMPHTLYTVPGGSTQATLEIQGRLLERADIEHEHVDASRPEFQTALILFGCRTEGTADDKLGFARYFQARGATVVFSSLTDLLGDHAAELAARLAQRIRTPGDGARFVPDLLAEVRREAIRDGYLAAFAITATGDADWRI